MTRSSPGCLPRGRAPSPNPPQGPSTWLARLPTALTRGPWCDPLPGRRAPWLDWRAGDRRRRPGGLRPRAGRARPSPRDARAARSFARLRAVTDPSWPRWPWPRPPMGRRVGCSGGVSAGARRPSPSVRSDPCATTSSPAPLAALRDNERRLAFARSEAAEPTQLEQIEREKTRLEDQVRRMSRRTTGDRLAGDSRLDVDRLVTETGEAAFVELLEIAGDLHAVVVTHGRVRTRRVGPVAEAERAADFARYGLRQAARGRPARPWPKPGTACRRPCSGPRSRVGWRTGRSWCRRRQRCTPPRGGCSRCWPAYRTASSPPDDCGSGPASARACRRDRAAASSCPGRG